MDLRGTSRPLQWSDFGPGPLPPSDGLPIPTVVREWRPPTLVAGSMVDLLSALRSADTHHVRIGADIDRRVGQATVAAALGELAGGAWQVSVDDAARGPVDGDMPVVRRPDEHEDGPLYRADLVQVDEAWPGWQGVDARSDKVVYIATAPVSLAAWRALPSRSVGSCDLVISSLGVGQEQALAMLEPFLDYSDRLLRESFRQELAGQFGLLERAVAQAESEVRSSEAEQGKETIADTESTCIATARARLATYRACLVPGSQCDAAPRLLLANHAVVGLPRPSLEAMSCSGTLVESLDAATENMATRAARRVSHYQDLQWSELADRFATLTGLVDALASVCVPRRQHFEDDDVAELGRRLDRISAEYRSAPMVTRHASWRKESRTLRLPGVGVFQVVSQFDAGPGSVAERIRGYSVGLRTLAAQRARCIGESGARPLAVLVLDTRRRRVEHVSLLYDEQLWCPTR